MYRLELVLLLASLLCLLTVSTLTAGVVAQYAHKCDNWLQIVI